MNSILFLLCTFGAILTCLDESLIKAAPVHSDTRNLNPVTTPRPVLSDDHRKQWQGGCNQNCENDINFYCNHQDKWCHQCGMFCDGGDEDDKCKEECPALYDSQHTTKAPPPGKPTPTAASRNETLRNPTGSSIVPPTNKTTPLSGKTPLPINYVNDTSGNVSQSISDTSKSDNLWLIGVIVSCCLGVAFVCIVGFYVRKYNPEIFRKKQLHIPPPTPCTEDHRRAPAFYQGRGEHAIPHVNAQRGADQPLMPVHQPLMPGHQPLMPGHQPLMPGHQPLMPGHQPLMPGYQPLMPGHQPLMQPSSAMQGQAMPLETLGGNSQSAANRFRQPSNSSSNSNDRVLVTGADDSFVYSDQSPDQSTQV